MANNKQDKIPNVPNKRAQRQIHLNVAERAALGPKGNVPALRFPEFDGEWKRISLSDLLEFFSTNSLSWEQLEYDGNEIQNLHYGLIHVGLPILVDTKENKLPTIKSEFVPRNYEVVKEGDVAFADASEDTNEVAKTVEFVRIGDRPIVCGLHTIHGRDKTNTTIPGFKGYYFSSPIFHQQIRRLAQGTKIFSISTKILGECFISIPSQIEQKKIASLLSLLDDRIATQRKIIEDLEQLKSAIRTKLFSSRQTEQYLSDIANVIMGQSPSSAAYNKDRIGLPLVQGNLDIENGKTKPRFHTSEITQTAKRGDVILTVRAPVGEVAIANEDICIGRGVCAICPKNTTNNKFIYQFLIYHKPAWNKIEQGSTFTSVSGKEIRCIKIPKPYNTNILSLVDTKIALERDVLYALNIQKQYLLQNLFI